MNNVQVVILAAGKGTRMGHPELPKVLVELNGRSLISHLLIEVDKLGLELPAVIVVGFKADLVKQHLGDKYLYIEQKEQLGTAHAVAVAKDYVTTDNVLVLYGDMPLIKVESLRRLIKYHLDTKSKFTMFTADVKSFEEPYHIFSNFARIIREKGYIVKITELAHLTDAEKTITEVNPGIYIFNTQWLWKNIDSALNNSHPEKYLTDLVATAVRQEVKINTLEIKPEEIFGINTLRDLQQAEQFVE
ncbi:MAG: NTP transferase domain-containing protein [Candidatus Doudnabacteria bacterium]|nr:NTP transferase domain-containing protein [Candidatus Doudnabacteria bacterium]